ncbi:hypothetical protein MferCBS31731_005576 [Microsporum ferrugineum]
MSFVSSQQSYAAFCEEFDEDANVAIPETRRVANISAKRSKPELHPVIVSTDGASDSGYSSRTAATIGSSGESLASGASSSYVVSLNNAMAGRDMPRMRSRGDGMDREKQHSRKAKEREQKEMEAMQHEGMKPPSRGSSRPTSLTHPPKGRRRESMSAGRHPPGMCTECDRLGYHHQGMIPNMMDPRTMDASSYFNQIPGYDVPPSPQTPRYQPMDMGMSQITPAISHSRRSNSSSYYQQSRPVSFHPGIVPDMNMMYMAGSPSAPYAGSHAGPPLSASAYTNTYMPSPFESSYTQPSPIMGTSYENSSQLTHYERPRTSSISRPASERPRRGSVYGPAVVENTPPTPSHMPNLERNLERRPSRERRARRQSRTYHDEDYYRMPPPRLPAPKPAQAQPPVQVIPITKRPTSKKSSTTPSAPTVVHRPQSFDMTDMREALPPPRVSQYHQPQQPQRRASRSIARENAVREESPEARPIQTIASSRPRRAATYYDAARPARVTVEAPRRPRRVSTYGIEQENLLEQKQREVEEYQAARAPKPAPFTTEMIQKVSRRVSKARTIHQRQPDPEPEPQPEPEIECLSETDTDTESEEEEEESEEEEEEQVVQVYPVSRASRQQPRRQQPPAPPPPPPAPVPAPVPLTNEMLRKAASRRPPPIPHSETESDDDDDDAIEDDDSSPESSDSEDDTSDVHTKNGSAAGSRVDDDSITMIIRGVKIGLSSDAIDGKTINFRSGEEGGVELNIGGRKRDRYILPRSDTASTGSRREADDIRRLREDHRAERDSRRSSRSGYSGRGLLE